MIWRVETAWEGRPTDSLRVHHALPDSIVRGLICLVPIRMPLNVCPPSHSRGMSLVARRHMRLFSTTMHSSSALGQQIHNLGKDFLSIDAAQPKGELGRQQPILDPDVVTRALHFKSEIPLALGKIGEDFR